MSRNTAPNTFLRDKATASIQNPGLCTRWCTTTFVCSGFPPCWQPASTALDSLQHSLSHGVTGHRILPCTPKHPRWSVYTLPGGAQCTNPCQNVNKPYAVRLGMNYAVAAQPNCSTLLFQISCRDIITPGAHGKNGSTAGA